MERIKAIPAKLEKSKVKKARILVVDDEEGICNMLRKILAKEGYEVETAQDARTGINLYKKNKYNLMFMDVVMPGLGGLKALKEIKKINAKAKVILITGKPIDRRIFDKLAEGGAYTCIKKPFRLDELINIVNHALVK